MPLAIDLTKRLKIIESINSGLTNDEIASELQINKVTVERWQKRYLEEGNVNTKYSTNHRPIEIDNAIKEQVLLKAVEDPFKPSTTIKRELNLDFTPQSINRILRSEGFNTHHAASKPKISELQRQDRIAFANAFKGQIDWTSCIFCDESCFSSARIGTRLVKRPRNTRYNPENVHYTDQSHRKTVSVWSAICYNKLGPIIRMDSRLTQQTYCEILDNYIVDLIKAEFGVRQCFLVDDNCPAHKGWMVDEWFNCCNALHGINLKLLRLPAYSPDINIIENFWGFCKSRLLEDNFVVRSEDQFFEKIQEVWAEISIRENFIKPYFDSINNRLDMIIANNGYPIKY